MNYIYVDSPTVSSLSPTSGSTIGGQSVTISGSDLQLTTNITFGGVPASFAVLNSETAVAITPAGTAGAVDVVVTTDGGSATVAGGFTYVNLTRNLKKLLLMETPKIKICK